jgi:hypothetical protein
MSEQQLPHHFPIELPADVPTDFADYVHVWHTPDVIILDVMQLTVPPHPETDVNGVTAVVVPARAVHRLKVPISQAFKLMQVMNEHLDAWEQEQKKGPAAA